VYIPIVGDKMTFTVEPSTFGIGYSIFRVKIVYSRAHPEGREVKVYVADVKTVAEAKALVPVNQKHVLEVN